MPVELYRNAEDMPAPPRRAPEEALDAARRLHQRARALCPPEKWPPSQWPRGTVQRLRSPFDEVADEDRDS